MKKAISILSLILVLLAAVGLLVSCKEEKSVVPQVTFVVDGESSETVAIDADGNLSLPTDPYREGYTFEGWYYDDGSWQRPLDATVERDATVYARFTSECAHRVDEWRLQKASCMTAGKKLGRCAVCGQLVAEPIPARGYHTSYVDKAVAPTCTTAGLTEGAHCADCFEVLTKQERIAALEHDYVNDVCTRCGDIYDPVEDAILRNGSVSYALDYSEGDDYTFVEDERVQPTSGAAYAVFRSGYVATDRTPVTRGGDPCTRLCYIGLRVAADASAEAIAAAQREAGEHLRYAFRQIETGVWPTSTTILLQNGITLDVSGSEWETVKYFGGYLGTVRAELNINKGEPAVIKGIRITKSVLYGEEFVEINGEKRNLYVAAFIGTMSEAVVKNLRFTDLTIEQALPEEELRAKVWCVAAPIGAGMDIPLAYERERSHIRNAILSGITVDGSCTIRGAGVASGLLGYFGGYFEGANGMANATMRMTKIGAVYANNCMVAATVASAAASSYAPVGGLIGSIGRSIVEWDEKGNPSLYYYASMQGCVTNGRLVGYQGVGAAVGDVTGIARFFISEKGDYTSATLTILGETGARGLIGTSIENTDFRHNQTLNDKLPLDENGNALPLIGRTR